MTQPATNQTPARSEPYGINVSGYLTAELGVGEAARGYISGLQRLGIKLALNDYSHGTRSRSSDTTYTEFTTEHPYPINLICVNANLVKRFIRQTGRSYLKGKYNIGAWWWELPEFPNKWHNRFKHFDQIWVGSEFARKAIQAATSIPVIRIPPVVQASTSREYTKADFGVSPNEFVFLFAFDFFSIFERKNPLAVISAFKQAFPNDDAVRLIIKCINHECDHENMKRLTCEAEDTRITIISGYLSKDEKNGLISIADCYVSLHRSEGFGYTMAEAMLLGKPVIATNWSGNTDFMTDHNSYPVDYRLVEITSDCGPYKKGQIWAEPDIDCASALMRHIYLNPSEAREKGVQAARDIREKHSASAVAGHIRNSLDLLRTAVRRPTDKPFTRLFKRLIPSSH